MSPFSTAMFHAFVDELEKIGGSPAFIGGKSLLGAAPTAAAVGGKSILKAPKKLPQMSMANLQQKSAPVASAAM